MARHSRRHSHSHSGAIAGGHSADAAGGHCANAAALPVPGHVRQVRSAGYVNVNPQHQQAVMLLHQQGRVPLRLRQQTLLWQTCFLLGMKE